jgi:hypothetical protein
MIISRSALPRMGYVSDKSSRENQNTHFMFNDFLKSCRLLETWKNMVEPDRPQMTIWRMPIAWWIPKATKTHSECVTHTALEQQQWLRNTDIVLPPPSPVWNHWSLRCARLKFRSVVCNVCAMLRTMVCQFLVLTAWMPTLPCQAIQWFGGNPERAIGLI